MVCLAPRRSLYLQLRTPAAPTNEVLLVMQCSTHCTWSPVCGSPVDLRFNTLDAFSEQDAPTNPNGEGAPNRSKLFSKHV